MIDDQSGRAVIVSEETHLYQCHFFFIKMSVPFSERQTDLSRTTQSDFDALIS